MAQKPQPKASRITLLIAVLGGLAFGGGGASAWFLLRGEGVNAALAASDTPVTPASYVTVPRLTVPMVGQNTELLGYITLDLALEVPADRAEYIKQHIPMIRHGLNALLYGGGDFGKPDQPEQLDLKRATPAMLKAANDALAEPVIQSLSVITAIPS